MPTFESLGRFIHRHRVPALAVSVVLLVASGVVASLGGTLASYAPPKGTEAGEALELVDADIEGYRDTTYLLVFSHAEWRANEARYRDAVTKALGPLRADERVASVTTPYNVAPMEGATMTSRDGHHIVAVVALAIPAEEAQREFGELKALVKSTDLTIRHSENVALFHEFETILQDGLKVAETFSLPLVLLLLLVVFGSVVAALLPLGVGLLAVTGGVAGVFLLSRVTDVSVYSVNIVTLIGLGVAIDYSLFVVSRFREELATGASVEESVARSMATAGRAVAFSGLTVAVGLAGLAFYRGLYLATMGVAGTLVVAFAVVYALTFLPALLSVLGHRVDALRLPRRKPRPGRGFWHSLATGVMRRPLLVLLPCLLVLGFVASPFVDLRMASAGVGALPKDAEARQGHDLVATQFPEFGATRILLVADFPGAPFSNERVGALYDYSRAVASVDGVTRVVSVVDLDPRMGKADYQALYAQPRSAWPAGVQEAANATTGSHTALLVAYTNAGPESDEARAIVDTLRDAHGSAGDARVLVSGETALDLDTIELIRRDTPVAVAFVVVTTYLLLLAQTRSIILPLKAVVMNFISIGAAFGAMVWIFQQGNLSALLDFTPGPLDPSLPVLLFCIVFGLSMDYEVLMLSRMHEEWERTGDNTHAVAEGLERSGRLITSAALIMIVVFGAFAFSGVVIIKAIGLGLAIAIATDATIVRALVVPSMMRLMGRANWWNPWKKRTDGPT